MKKTVLVVEDEPIPALELSETVRSLGFRVPEPVLSADKVLTAMMNEEPDAVFMDINLSGFIDGIDTARRIKLLRDIPLIFLTAYNNEETKKRAERTQPVEYLVKPVSREQIRKALDKAFSS
ncbi:MAG: response regulator [Spirochaetales bacterium]|nr:response regulator [Spirochaetales bacterium]